MTLKQYSKYIAKLAEKHPNAKVICAADEEGNNFSVVQFKPCLGNYDGNEFIVDRGTQGFKDNYKVNSIRIN